MPRNLYRPLFVAGAAALLVACGDNAEDGVPQQPDANPVATIPTPADEASAPVFVERAAASDMFEIQSSQLAAERTQNADVRAFAQMMITDHTKSTNDLQAALQQSGLTVTPPQTLPQDKAEQIQTLRDTEAGQFDMAYLNQQVDAHQAALDLMQRYANDGDNEALRNFALATAPVIQNHYDRVVQLRDRMQGEGGSADAM